MNVGYYIINFSPIWHNINAYTIKYNNHGDKSTMDILDDGNLCDTIISDNIELIINKIP